MAGAVVPAEAAGAVPDGVMAVEVTTHDDAQAGTGAAPRLLGDLQRDTVGGDDVIATDHAFIFETEDLIEIDPAEGNKGGGGISGRSAKLRVEAGQEVIAQVTVGRGDSGDAGHPQFIDEAALERLIRAFSAAARLGRIAEDVLDA